VKYFYDIVRRVLYRTATYSNGGIMNRHVGLLFALGLLAIAAMTSATIAQQPAPGGRGAAQQPVTMVFKEAWKDTSTMALMSQSYVTNPDLELKMYGTGKEDFSVTNEGGVPRHKDSFMDLTGKAKIRWYMKTSGFHEIRPVLKLADGTWLIGDHVDADTIDYRQSEFYLSGVKWLKLDITKVQTKGTLLDKVDLTRIDEIGFADLTPGSGHGTGGYSDMGWIEVYGKAVKRDAAK
jgi:hypothetical protein